MRNHRSCPACAAALRHSDSSTASLGTGSVLPTCAPHLASTTSQGARYFDEKLVWQRRRWLSLHRLHAVLAQPRFLPGESVHVCRWVWAGMAAQRPSKATGNSRRAAACHAPTLHGPTHWQSWRYSSRSADMAAFLWGQPRANGCAGRGGQQRALKRRRRQRQRREPTGQGQGRAGGSRIAPGV